MANFINMFLFQWSLRFGSMLVVIGGIVYPTSLYGAMLSEVEFQNGDRVGILLSTFDPVTTYHEQLVEAALATDKIDYLVLVPTDFTPHKPRRTLVVYREEMLKVTFESHPKVVLTDAYQYGFPHSRGITSYLRMQQKARLHITGVVLFDDLAGKALNQKIVAFLTPVDNWLVLKPAVMDTESFPLAIGGKPVEFAIAESPLSSKRARDYLKGNLSFFSGDADPSFDELPVNASVRKYIREKRIFFKAPPRCAILIDMLHSWTPF